MAAQAPDQHKKLDGLCEKYPELFINPPFEIPRPEGYTGPLHVFRCADGWHDILDSWCHRAHHKLKRWREVVEIRERIEQKIAEGDEHYVETGVPEWIPKFFEENPEDPLKTFRFDQIKEKFGGLRIYFGGVEFGSENWNYLDGLTNMAEAWAWRTCELCGSNKDVKTQGRGYIQTLCQPCNDAKYAEAKKRRDEWEKQQEAKNQATQSSADEGSEEGSDSLQG